MPLCELRELCVKSDQSHAKLAEFAKMKSDQSHAKLAEFAKMKSDQSHAKLRSSQRKIYFKNLVSNARGSRSLICTTSVLPFRLARITGMSPPNSQMI